MVRPHTTPSPSALMACDEPWSVAPDELLELLRSDREGLDSDEAGERLAAYGPNELPRQASERALALLLRQFMQPLIYVLLGAVVVSLVIEHWVDAGVIAAVVLVNGLIGFVQEYRAGREMQALLELVAESCTVLRDGAPQTLPTRDVVPGDVIVIAAGEKVPADARLLAGRGLSIDEALLTGESVPVDKHVDPELEEGTPLPERLNMLYSGTLATAGQGRALITATGGRTELARIAELVGTAETVATPLTRRITAFSRLITWVILVVAAVTFGLALARGYEAVEGFLAAVALAVAAIPEGLPAIITIALAIGLRRMAARNAVVRHLPAVEALGSTTVICSDKTGTLTRNEMVITELRVPGTVAVSGDGYEPVGEFGPGGGSPGESVRIALQAGLLCSDARLVQREGAFGIVGDPTEGALVVAAAKAGLTREGVEAAAPRIDELPFESERRFMATLHRSGEGHRAIVKGAPEVILERCERTAWGGDWNPAAVLEEVDDMAARGLRVLAVADKDEPSGLRQLGGADLDSGYTLLGLLGLLDPPRSDAIDAIAACHRAGVRVVMITGDHPRTAAAIAARMGISDGSETVTGAELENLADAELERVAAEATVFARVAPEHKLQLVSALQRRGEIVAMTGDGVNDAAALKQADIGVAMGITGTAVSKEAADIVLRDDNFATIRAAVEEGRRVFDNLIKAIVFILPTNAGESLLVLGVIGLGLTLPLLPVQLLWINTITAVTLALPLAFEARERGVMQRPPRRPNAPILDRVGVQRILIVGIVMFLAGVAVFEIETARGTPAAEARTHVVTLIVLLEAFYLLTCRSLHGSLRDVGILTNPSIYAGIVLVVLFQAGYVYLPFMHVLFDSTPLTAMDWLEAAVLASFVLPAVSLHKRLTRRGQTGA
jgi:magnesium-transporting ATPase (P-type)